MLAHSNTWGALGTAANEIKQTKCCSIFYVRKPGTVMYTAVYKQPHY